MTSLDRYDGTVCNWTPLRSRFPTSRYSEHTTRGCKIYGLPAYSKALTTLKSSPTRYDTGPCFKRKRESQFDLVRFSGSIANSVLHQMDQHRFVPRNHHISLRGRANCRERPMSMKLNDKPVYIVKKAH